MPEQVEQLEQVESLQQATPEQSQREHVSWEQALEAHKINPDEIIQTQAEGQSPVAATTQDVSEEQSEVLQTLPEAGQTEVHPNIVLVQRITMALQKKSLTEEDIYHLSTALHQPQEGLERAI